MTVLNIVLYAVASLIMGYGVILFSLIASAFMFWEKPAIGEHKLMLLRLGFLFSILSFIILLTD